MSELSYSELVAARARVVEVARAILTGDLGVIEGSRQLMKVRLDVDPEQEDEDLLGMCGIESQTDHLPIGPVRQHWHPIALRQKDLELAENEAFFRDSALAMCRALVERYSPAA